MLQRLLPVLGFVAALGACDAGGTIDAALEGTFSGAYDYAALAPPISVSPDRSVAVAVIDQRPYVVNGEESDRFAGTMYGRFRDTVDVKTASGRPLADVVAEAVARTLGRQGAETAAVPVDRGATMAEALGALRGTGAERLIVIRMEEWRTDTAVRMEARWNLEAAVHDRAGELLGRRLTRGAEALGATRIADEDVGPLAVADLGRRLARLLDDPAIADALEGA